MPHFTRRPTDRLDDDLRRIAEERKPIEVWKFEDGHQIAFVDLGECETVSLDALIRDIDAAPIVNHQVFEAQERILNTGAEDAVVDGLVDYPL